MIRKFDGIRPSPPDPRDYKLDNFIPLGASLDGWMEWDFPSVPLDQLNTQHCGGFGMAHFGINLPVFRNYTTEDAHNFYYLCKQAEGNPLGEEGVYARTTAKVLQDLGIIENYAFAPDMESMRWWILNRGPVMIGSMWMDGMMKPDADNLIHATGSMRGGHFYVLNGYKDCRYRILNSWGATWGINGMAYIHEDDLTKLFAIYAEAITAVDLDDAIVPPVEPDEPPVIIEPPVVPPVIPPDTNKGCSAVLASLFRNGLK